MAEAIPMIIAMIATTVTAAQASRKGTPLPQPPEEDAEMLANEQSLKVAAGRDRFMDRSQLLGPIQLQAPTLKI